LQKVLDQYAARGVRLVAVTVDSPEVSRNHAAKQGYTFPILADEKREVIRRFDLLHEQGFRGSDISRPAEFLVDPSGIVRWANLTDDYKVRVKGEEILKVLDGLGLSAPAK
jgi:peroxiredoxin